MRKIRQHFEWPDGRIENFTAYDTSSATHVVLSQPYGEWETEVFVGKGEGLWTVRQNEKIGVRSRIVPIKPGWRQVKKYPPKR